jgi:tetratricopeptide (TPR) repeat protein
MTGWEIALKSITPASWVIKTIRNKMQGNYTMHKVLTAVGAADKGDFKAVYQKALTTLGPNTHPLVVKLFDRESMMDWFADSYHGKIEDSELQEHVYAQMSVNEEFALLREGIDDEIVAVKQHILAAILEEIDPKTRYICDLIQRVSEQLHDIKEDTGPTLEMVTKMYKMMTVTDPITITVPTEIKMVTGDFEGYIEDILEEIDLGRYESVIRLLGKYRAKYWERLSDEQRFKLDTNMALAHIAMGDTRKAAEYIIKLPEYKANSALAYGLAAMGYAYMDNPELTEGMALLAFSIDPHSPHAVVARILVLPPDADSSEFDRVLIKAPKDDVMVALYGAMYLKDLGAKARKQAMEMLETINLEPLKASLAYYEVIERKAVLATMIAIDEIVEGVMIVSASIRQQLTNALNWFDEAWDYYKETDLRKGKWNVLANRGVVKKVLGNTPEAERDFLAALQEQKHFFSYHHLLVIYMEEGRDNAALIEEIRDDMKLDPEQEQEVLFLELDNLLRNGKPDEVLKKLDGAKLGEGKEALFKREFFRSIAMKKKGQNQDALLIAVTLADAYPQDLMPNYQAADLAFAIGEPQFANNYMDKAIAAINGTEQSNLLEGIVSTLLDLQRFQDIINLLDRDSLKISINKFSGYLITALINVDLWGEAVELAEKCYNKDKPDHFCTRVMIEACERACDFEAAREYAENGIKHFPDEAFFYGKALGQLLREQKVDEVKFRLDQLSSKGWPIIRMMEVLAVAIPTSGHLNWNAGMQLAVQLRNGDLDNPESNRAYVKLIGTMRNNGMIETTEFEVKVGTKIILQALLDNEIKEIVIDDTGTLLNAVSSTDLHATKLIGCHIGSKVEIQGKEFKITRITPPLYTVLYDSIQRKGNGLN